MLIDFSGKSAFVTGGSNGIGLACAKRLSASGAVVTIFDREADTGTIARSFHGRGFSGDVRDIAALGDAIGEARPDVVVINAGMVAPAPLLKVSDEDWLKTIEVNLTGAWRTLRCAAEFMTNSRREGAVVVTASTNSFDGESLLAAYNASKAGLLGLVRTAANELGPYGIRVNAVCPGLIRTRLTAAHFENTDVTRPYFREIPLGRGGEAGEVATAVAFLASGAASFITGTTLVVDGGQMATKYGPWNDEIGTFDGNCWKLR